MRVLPKADWTARPGLALLTKALGADDIRWVGGAVRDTLLGAPVKDIDCATRHRPETVIDRCKAAGIRTVPTGIDHGTVTAILEDGPVEITTLRRDVTTDGRRATVAFAEDWREDAARRDFTINALYVHPATLEISDYFGGLDDLAARRVRFIGDAETRIREDHLRILQVFPLPGALRQCTRCRRPGGLRRTGGNAQGPQPRTHRRRIAGAARAARSRTDGSPDGRSGGARRGPARSARARELADARAT